MYSFDRILIYLKSHTVNLCKKPDPGIPSCPNLLQSQKYTAENASHNYICRLRKKFITPRITTIASFICLMQKYQISKYT